MPEEKIERKRVRERERQKLCALVRQRQKDRATERWTDTEQDQTDVER